MQLRSFFRIFTSASVILPVLARPALAEVNFVDLPWPWECKINLGIACGESSLVYTLVFWGLSFIGGWLVRLLTRDAAAKALNELPNPHSSLAYNAYINSGKVGLGAVAVLLFVLVYIVALIMAG